MPLGQMYPTYGGQGKIWFNSATVLGGVATFYPTDDGTPQGKPLFMEILSAFSGVSLSASKAVDVALASIKAMAPDRTSVDVCAVVGKTLGAVGDTMQYAPDGTVVFLQLWGN